MANEVYPFYIPGGDLTGHCEAAVTGKRFVSVSGDRQSGPGLSATAEGGNYLVSPAAAGEWALGVADRDAAQDAKVKVYCDFGYIVPVTAGADLVAGALVQVGTGGTAVPHTTGVPVGRAMTAATNGGDAEIRLHDIAHAIGV